MAHDRDEEGTSNALLMYAIEAQLPANTAFSLDAASGRIRTREMLRRKESSQYTLMVNVSDQGNRHTHMHTLTHDVHTHTHTRTHTHANV